MKNYRQPIIRLVRIYSIAFLGLVWFGSYAQSPDISLLRQRLAQATTDRSRTTACYALGKQYQQINLDSCLYFLGKSVQLAQRTRNAVAITRGMYQLGFTYLYVSRDEARAVYWFKRAIPVAKASNNNVCLADCYRLLGICAEHQRLGYPEEFMNKAVSYARKSNDWRTLTNTYQVYHELHAARKNYPLAEKYALLAMTSCRSHNLDNWFTSGLDLHRLLSMQGKQAEARVLARQLALVKDKLPKTDGEFVYINDTATLERILKHYANAEAALLSGISAENQRSKPDSLHLLYYYQSLLRVYSEQGDWQKAYRYSEKLADIRVWLEGKRQTQDARIQIMQFKSALAIEKKDNQIALLDAEQQQQRVFLIAALLVAGLLVGFIVLQRRNQQRIERQKAALTQLNATKNKLFAILSHDLRSPVANLQSNVMLTNWGGLNQQEFADSTQSLSVDIGYVRTMLDNVLSWSLSQMEGIKPWIQPCAIALLVEEQIQLLQPMANAKRIQVISQIPADAVLNADENHLSVMCRNLLQNALKFTHTGGRIWIDFVEKDGLGALTVRDTGIGMEPDLLANLFSLDKQISRRGTADEQGIGLGLVLVKELVDVNKGTLQVVSRVDNGTTFTLTFPAHRAPAGQQKRTNPTYA